MEAVGRSPVFDGVLLERNGHEPSPDEGFSLRILPATAPFLKRKELSGTLILSAVIAASYLYPLYERATGGVSFCWFHRITGLPCLLCGMTRSFAATARLHVSDAFYYHLLGPFFFLLALALLATYAVALARGKRVELKVPRRLRRGMGWFLLGALCAAWVLKMVYFGVNV
jgi:hypothetical protein